MCGALGLIAFALSASLSASAQELGSGRLSIVGARLAASPESQTVPLSTPTIVETSLVGWNPSNGVLPSNLVVVGELSGPEISGFLSLSTSPGEPFRIPRLALEGEYRLENIRLMQDGELLSYAEPRDAAILVTQVLVTRVSSRPLTLDEVRSYGVVLGDDNFRAFNFTFGFAVDGEIIDYNLPVFYNALNPGETLTVLGQSSPQFGASSGTTSPRFKPPQMAPFTLQMESSGGGGASGLTGGCQNADGCFEDEPVSLPGVILFPSEVSLLNQFFSVVLVAKNDAPEGDPLVIRDLMARVILPPGLRMAETEPPTPLGVPVPVRVPGPDGLLGTGDDLTFLIAQAEGQAEVVVEGRQQGTHVVEFQLEGVLDGLPGGVERVTGLARGAVVVRDPTLAMTVTHPDVVRNDEQYKLSVTVTNTSSQPLNLVSVSLPPGGLSGVELLTSGQQTIPSLPPAESEVVEFGLRSLRTGRVVATSVKSGSLIDPTFELTVGVGDAGIPLSPDALILPRSVEQLPAAVQRHALGLLGLGFSLSSAPESATTSGLPRLSREQIDEKAYWLAQAGRHVALGEDSFDSLAVVAAEWAGARDRDWEWDELRRITQRGGFWASALAHTFAAEAAATSGRAAFERFARTTSFLGPLAGAVVEGSAARLEVASRTTGDRLSGEGSDPLRIRELSFADLYGLGAEGQMALLAGAEAGGYQVRLTAEGGSADTLTLWLPDGAGGSRWVDFTGIALPPGGLAIVDFAPSDSLFTLFVDRTGDGLVNEEIPGAVSTLTLRPFTAVAAVQNAEEDPSGHIVDVLLTQDLDLASLLPLDPGRFSLPGKVSNGGLVPVEEDIANHFETVAENPFEGLRNSRIVRVIFDNPISPYVAHALTIRDLSSVAGATLSGVTLPVTTTVTEPGTQVEGTVLGPDGQPVPFALVELYEVDFFYHYPTPCRRHKTAAVRADSAGRFSFDYVRQTRCSDVFTLVGTDPVSGYRGDARGRMRFAGGSQQLDILMLGRGTLRGRVSYEDGTVPESPRVVAYSPVFFEGSEARVFADGRYEVSGVPVGTVSLAATDREGSSVFQTVELPTAGSVVERDLVIIRRSPDDSTGDVQGTVFEADGITPVFDAYVALYVDGELAGVENSDLDGSFDFGTVPAGRAEIEAFDGETGLSGAQVFFDIAADQVNDIALLLSDERGTVEGTVYRQEITGQVPVAGAVVWVSGTPFSTVTDAAGFYQLDSVFAGERTVLAADLDRQLQASAAVTVNGGGAVTFRDLIFPGASVGSGISGEVLGFSGDPVPGALVHIATGGGRWWHEVATDALGRFTLPELAPGSYELHAVDGAAGASKTVTIRFEGETPFVGLRFKKGSIRGTVRFENASGDLVGVQSLVTYRTTVVQEGLVGLDWSPHTIETAADGSFEIPDALVGPYSLHVSNPFHGERRIHGDLVFHGEVAEHDVLFQENGTIRVQVLDWDGETPLPGARVDLQHPAFSLYDLIADEEGRVTFELVPPVGGRFPIEAEITSGSLFRRARGWVRFNRFGQELDIEIVMPRQGTVSGFVEDASGNPVPGAVVTLREHAFPGRWVTQNADGEGSFRFTNIFAGTVSLAAKAPSLGGLGSKATVELASEGQEVYTLLQLEATGEIVGRVLSPLTGEPVPSVQVSIYRHGHGLFDSLTAAADGTYRFQLLPLGQYRVWVFDPATGRHGEREGAWVEFNQHVREADVTLEVRGEIDGHLSDPGSGHGVPGATIRAAVHSLVPFVTYSSTDVEGYFEFLGIPESTFRLDTREPEGRRRASGSGSINAEGERVTVDLVLEASGSVTGTVLNPPGAPTGPFASVNTLIYQDGQVVGATLDNPYTFDGLIAGRSFRIEAHEVGGDHRGEATGRLESEGELVTVDVTMRPIGEAEVTVRDSFGNLVAGANVGLRSSGFYRQGAFSASTGAAGTALFTQVGEGHLSTWASSPATGLGGSAEGTLTFEGERVPLTVQLADSGAVEGVVLLSDGTTPAEEALVVLTIAGRTSQTFAAADGSFRFDAAPLGSFAIFVQERFGPGTARARGTLAANGGLVDVGTLVMDDADPAVIELLPALYSVDQSLASTVTIRFSEPLDVARFTNAWVSFRSLSGATVAYSASWIEGNATLVLTPNAPLASHTSYQVTVQDAYDPAGRQLFEPARTIFTTVDVTPPTVIDVLPRDGEIQLPVHTQMHLTFSEPVVPASLNGSSLQLTDRTTGTGVSTTWLQIADGRKAVVTPVGGLAADREYQLTIQGLEDGSGNVMTTPVITTFWTLDTTPPDIASVILPAGNSFTAGDDVPVQVDATDSWGVARVTVQVNDWTFSDESEPFEITALAPMVASAETVSLTIEAVDIHGNVASTTRDIQVDPLVNASTPETWAGCALNGDAVVPGIEIGIGVEAEDDQAIESLTAFVDGVEIGSASPVNLARGSAIFPWTPPTGASPGTSYSVRLEARDFAGNLSVHDLVVSVPTGTILVGGRSLLGPYDGEDITLAEGIFLVRNPLAFASLRVVGGASIEPPEGFTDLDLTASGEIRVQCGAEVRHGPEGRTSLSAGGDVIFAPRSSALANDVAAQNIFVGVGSDIRHAPGGWLRLAAVSSAVIGPGAVVDVTGEGFAGGADWEWFGHAPSEVSPSAAGAGGSHGGLGESTQPGYEVGESYDSVYRPTLAGGGGGPRRFNTAAPGQPGGGVIEVAASSLVLDGTLRARGSETAGQSGGAGGTVLLRVGSLSGGGLVDASGGDSPGCTAVGSMGGGGGGRIAVQADDLSGFDPVTQTRAWGGRRDRCWSHSLFAGPGTVYLRDNTSTYGRLMVDNGLDENGAERSGPTTPLPALGAGSVASFQGQGADAWLTAAEGPRAVRWLGTWVTLSDAAGLELGAFEVLSVDAAGRLLLRDAGSLSGVAEYRGEYRFDSIDLLHGAGLEASDPVSGTRVDLRGEVELEGEVHAADVVVHAGAVIRPATGGVVRMVATRSVVIEAGAVVDVTGEGFAGGAHWEWFGYAPAEVSPSSAGVGGSHGGLGQATQTGYGVGESYDSVFWPQLAGGGGGPRRFSTSAPGQPGGGVIEIETPSLLLDGELRARGGETAAQSGGGGGTVLLRVGSLAGSGLIDASGGDSPGCTSVGSMGGGGGGRIALHVDGLSGFDPATQTRAWGGERGLCWSHPRYAGPGTVYLRDAEATHGQLLVDNGLDENGTGRNSSIPTPLPSLGRGLIGMVEVDLDHPADLWVEPQDPDQRVGLGVVGVFARIQGVDYPVLAEAGDRRRFLLGGASGAVSVGDAFVGVYKFDEVVVTRGHLTLEDGVEVATLTVGPESSMASTDLDPPAIAIIAPTEGAAFTSGEAIAVAATVTDASAIDSVVFTLGSQTFTDTTPPWEWTVAAPAVTEEGDALIQVAATDAEGNVGTAQRTVHLLPLGSASLPSVAIACPSDGALLAPGTGLEVVADATHENGIEKVELFIGGSSQPVATDFAAPYSLRLNAPLEAVSGQVIAATVRATSFAGTRAEVTRHVTVVEGAVLTADTFLAAGDTRLDGGAVIVAGGTLTIEGPHSFTNLVVLDGAVVTHLESTDLASTERLDLALSGDLFVACGGGIDANGRGHRTAADTGIFAEDHFATSASLNQWQVVDEGTSQGPSSWVVSGTHLRQQSNINTSGATWGTYLLWGEELPVADYRLAVRMNSNDDDSIGVMFRYVDANNYYRFRWGSQTPGQWLERIEDGQVTLLASSSVPYRSSVWYWVEVDVSGSAIEVRIDGTTALTATDTSHSFGRVALYSAGNDGSVFDDLIVSSLEDGLEAAAHFEDNSWNNDWEIVDQPGASEGPSNWFRDGNAQYLKQTSNIYRNPDGFGTYARWLGPVPGADYRVGVNLVSGDDDHIGLHFRQSDPDNYYRFRWSRASGGAQILEKVENGRVIELVRRTAAYAQWRWYRVDIEVVGSRMQAWVNGELVLAATDSTHTEGTVALYCGGNVHSYYDDFRISSPSRSTVEGGSHGGRGGLFQGGGELQGTLFDPAEAGSGGGGPSAMPGGGVVRIDSSGRAVVDGSVTALGVASDTRGAAGAGGSIQLHADSVTGGGVLRADGGDGSGLHAAGSGGRVAVYAGSWNADLPERISAAGGLGTTDEATGAAGTIFLKLDHQPLGDLLLDNQGRATTQFTELPALLPGTVGSVTADSITDPAASFPDGLAGAELYFNGSTGSLWTVADNDGQRLKFDESQGPVSAQPGDGYQGLYRFDQVTVRGGARGIARNPVWTSGTPTVEPGSEWLADYRPTLSITAPSAGADFYGGDSFDATIAATDELGIASVRFTLAGMEYTTSVAPYVWPVTIPVVPLTLTHPLTVEVTNFSGQVTVASVDVTLRASGDGTAPVVSLDSASVRKNEVLLPGTWVHLDFTATDEEALQSYALVVGGVVEQEQSLSGETVVAAGFDWLVPSDAPVGTHYTLRIEARDFGGNVGAVEHPVRAPAGPVLTGNQSLDSAVDGTHVTLGSGTFTVSEAISPASFILLSGAVVRGEAGELLSVSTGEVRLQAGSQIDVAELGYGGGTQAAPVGGAPPGIAGSQPDAGGSHGGFGSPWDLTAGPAGEVYDSVYLPQLPGGGGALDGDGFGDGGAGGGAVWMEATEVLVDGDIVATGHLSNADEKSAGAGGSVTIRADRLSGTGNISAVGGWVRSCAGHQGVGAGGGGRIALWVDDLTDFDPKTQVQAVSNPFFGCGWNIYRYAGTGTVYVTTADHTYGDLRIDAGEEPNGLDRGDGPTTELPALGSGVVTAFAPAGTDAWVTGSGPFRPRWQGAWMALEDAGGETIGIFRVVDLDAAGRTLLAGAGGVTGASSYRGEYRFDRIDLMSGAGLLARDPVLAAKMEVDGAAELSGPVIADDLTIRAGAVVVPAETGTLRLEAPGSLTVEAGAVVDVRGQGYVGGTPAAPDGGAPAGVQGSLLDAGGSHGGLGSPWDLAFGPAGEVFDSVYLPSLAGGGGGFDNDGAGDGLAGGGVIEIVAGSVTLDGDLMADGSYSNDAGQSAGAGGTVSIDAASLSGAGRVYVNGGYARACGAWSTVGAGGGGRVAVRVGSLSGFDPASQIQAFGNGFYSCSWHLYRCAASGTVYLWQPSMTHGELRVEHWSGCTGTELPNTPLPALGNGLVGLIEADAAVPSDLWIEPQDPAALFDRGVVGMTVRIAGSDFLVVDQTPDRRRVLLADAVGQISVGDSYEGVYKFDKVTVRGGAVLEFLDSAEVGIFDIDANSQVIQP
ncbi:MAG: carboxypeptidase regulatory-like domain-containing protein [Acidobacteriota bacterium]